MWRDLCSSHCNQTTGLVSFYVNGDIVGTATSTINAGGIVAGAKHFIVGANGDAAHSLFTGDISDVRVWTGARSAAEILNDFDTRLAYTTGPVHDIDTGAALALNWKLSNDASQHHHPPRRQFQPVRRASSNRYSDWRRILRRRPCCLFPALCRTYRQASVGVCPAGTVAHTYECDFRAAAQSSTAGAFIFPSNLESVFAKVWGGGGGGYSASDGVTLNTMLAAARDIRRHRSRKSTARRLRDCRSTSSWAAAAPAARYSRTARAAAVRPLSAGTRARFPAWWRAAAAASFSNNAFYPPCSALATDPQSSPLPSTHVAR